MDLFRLTVFIFCFTAHNFGHNGVWNAFCPLFSMWMQAVVIATSYSGLSFCIFYFPRSRFTNFIDICMLPIHIRIFKYLFYFYLRESQRERDFQIAGSLPTWPQCAELNHSKAESRSFFQVSCMCSGAKALSLFCKIPRP